ncbi:hypothetical protein D3C81_1754640 [compost metagenome]
MHEHRVRRSAAVNHRVVAIHAQDLLGTLLAVGLAQAFEVGAGDLVALGGGRVEDRFHVAVAVVVGAQFELFPEVVGFAVTVHDQQFEGHFTDGFGFATRSVYRRFVGHAGVHGVMQVLVEHFPVRALLNTEDAAGHLDFTDR